jgi:hypothetical protein
MTTHVNQVGPSKDQWGPSKELVMQLFFQQWLCLCALQE